MQTIKLLNYPTKVSMAEVLPIYSRKKTRIERLNVINSYQTKSFKIDPINPRLILLIQINHISSLVQFHKLRFRV